MGTCPVPGPRSTGGQRLAHAGVSGETCAVVTWKSCQGVGRVDSLRRLMRGIGAGVGPVRVRRYSGAVMARIPGTGRSAGEGCGPGGLSLHWGSGSCDDPAGAPVPWLSQAMVLRRHPCRGAASLSELLFPGPEWQSPQAARDGPGGLRYKGQGHGVCNTHPGYVPHVQYDVPDGVQRGTDGVYHLIDNHGDDTGRGEEDEMEYVPVSLPVPRDGRAFSRCFGVSRSVGLEVPALRGSLS